MAKSKFIYFCTPSDDSIDAMAWHFYYACKGYQWATAKGHACYAPAVALMAGDLLQTLDKEKWQATKNRAIEACDIFIVLPYQRGNPGFRNAEVLADMQYAIGLGKRLLAAVPRDDSPREYRFQRMEK